MPRSAERTTGRGLSAEGFPGPSPLQSGWEGAGSLGALTFHGLCSRRGGQGQAGRWF